MTTMGKAKSMMQWSGKSETEGEVEKPKGRA